MMSYPSRAERRQVKLYTIAEKGELLIKDIVLYPREIDKLEKDGFNVYNIKPYRNTKDLFTATVSWANAFGTAIPHMVSSYITGTIDTFPSNFVEKLAHELYVIAQRTKNNK